MMKRAVRTAVLFSFLLHGALILAGRYRMSYDAYVHMFFADHYRMEWWSLWDPRWYTGFFVTSYPPLVHQLIAALSQLVGLDTAFALILWITVTLLPLAVYAFARIFVGEVSAGYASLGAAFLPAAFLTAHIFGQLPFLFGTVLALFGAASLARYLREGGPLNFALTIAIITTTMAAHHAVLILQPFLIFAVVMKLLPGHDDKVSKKPELQQLTLRIFLFGFLALLCSLIVIFPFWEWGRTQTIQTPIDHASRHNFFQDPLAPLLFFLPMYGPLMLVIPFVFALARKKGLVGLSISFFFLFLLGLGGTTPLPRLFFGKGWEWLTFDRFAFWASLLLLPFFGMATILVRRRFTRLRTRNIFIAMAVSCLIVILVHVILPLQPGAVDMPEVVSFLKQDDRSTWRYLTFGFGDQLALLSTLTTATTIDGSYHTARTLPELRTSGIAQIDTAFWFPNGLNALDPILQRSGEHGVRWGFVNIPQYIPVLERNGWIKITTLEGGVQVWENLNARLPEPSQPPPAKPLASFAWGTFPLLSLVITTSLASLKLFPIQAEKALRGAFALLISLIPLALCFWYYRTLGDFQHQRVYFTYDHALFFLVDGLALLGVILWLAVKVSHADKLQNADYQISFRPIYPMLFFVILVGLATVSAFWSDDWRTSLYISLHLWLVTLLIFSLHDWSEVWKPVMWGLCAALAIQVITGFAGFALQSSSFLQIFDMRWPGMLDASIRGASVVQLQNGLRILRAYGTLPHPNILGGFTLIFLMGPTSLFLESRKPNYAASVLLVLGIILIGLTFSRSAWLGLLAFLVVLIMKHRYLGQRRLFLFIMISALALTLTLFTLRDLVVTRIQNAPVQTEQLSTFGRSWLTSQAIDMIREHPLWGVGTGSFIIQLSETAIEGAIIEPVHNFPLLIGSELGIFGFLVLAGLFVAIVLKIVKGQSPQAILASGTLAGIGVISFFDHYLWSIAPGRIMLGLALGLWLGQAYRNAA